MMNRSENYPTIKLYHQALSRYGMIYAVNKTAKVLFYFVDAPDGVSTCHMLEIEDEAA